MTQRSRYRMLLGHRGLATRLAGVDTDAAGAACHPVTTPSGHEGPASRPDEQTDAGTPSHDSGEPRVEHRSPAR